MAKIEDLIAQIPDERLRKGIAAEVKALKKTKKFGLVFEEHLPETVRLPRLPIKPGEIVALKQEPGNLLWKVRGLKKNIATCDRAVAGYLLPREVDKEFPISDLVVVRSFGDPIYPALVPVDRVERGGPDKPWHLLINADNFHALQLLLYCYESKVDVIYIDPPYNKGARDWKYNNDYVDKNDAFRHSKWLSMIKKNAYQQSAHTDFLWYNGDFLARLPLPGGVWCPTNLSQPNAFSPKSPRKAQPGPCCGAVALRARIFTARVVMPSSFMPWRRGQKSAPAKAVGVSSAFGLGPSLKPRRRLCSSGRKPCSMSCKANVGCRPRNSSGIWG